MKTVKEVAITLIRTETSNEGKEVIKRRRFARLNPQTTDNEALTFKTVIEKLTGEKFDSVELTTVEAL